MTKLSLDYIAGIFDGEGHVSITWTHNRKGSKDPKLCVKICNTHLPIILLIKEQFNGTLYKPKKTKDSYLQVYYLSFNVTESKFFLESILPYLYIKYEQAIVALEFSKTVYRRGKGKVSKEEKLIREQCMEKVRELKQEQWEYFDTEEDVMSSWIQYRQSMNERI